MCRCLDVLKVREREHKSNALDGHNQERTQLCDTVWSVLSVYVCLRVSLRVSWERKLNETKNWCEGKERERESLERDRQHMV